MSEDPDTWRLPAGAGEFTGGPRAVGSARSRDLARPRAKPASAPESPVEVVPPMAPGDHVANVNHAQQMLRNATNLMKDGRWGAAFAQLDRAADQIEGVLVDLERWEPEDG